MKIERVVKHFIRLKGQGQGEPQGVQEGATHPVAPAAQSKRKKGVATSCFLSIIEIAILPFDDLTRGTWKHFSWPQLLFKANRAPRPQFTQYPI